MSKSIYKVVRIITILLWIALLTFGFTKLYMYSNKVYYTYLFELNYKYIATGFAYPVGQDNGQSYYIAQRFLENDHLGDDWNNVTGGDTDLGEPIFSIANGYVSMVKNLGGNWGKVIKVIHYYDGNFYESLYAHCQDIFVEKGMFVKKAQKIASIGNADGRYYAHLHLELRNQINLPVGYGYLVKKTKIGGYINPHKFIKENLER